MMRSSNAPGMITDLTGVEWEEILRPLREARVATSWLSGSLVEGLGNPSSDIDVFAVVPALDDAIPAIRKGADHFVHVYFSNSRRIDFEYWSERAIESLRVKLSAAPIGDGTKNLLDYFSEHEVEFVHRLHIGIPILEEEGFRELQKSFDRSRLIGYLFENKRIYVDDAFDDTVGLMREGHLRSAAFRARVTLDFSVDMLLYAYGISNHKEKHRYRLFLRLLPRYPELHRIYSRYLNMISNVPGGLAGTQGYIANALEFSEMMVFEATAKYQENIYA